MIEQVTFPLMVEAGASNGSLLILIALLIAIGIIVYFAVREKPKPR